MAHVVHEMHRFTQERDRVVTVPGANHTKAKLWAKASVTRNPIR
jgi:hypothetical protein